MKNLTFMTKLQVPNDQLSPNTLHWSLEHAPSIMNTKTLACLPAAYVHCRLE